MVDLLARGAWRRLFVVAAAPLVLYGAWRLGYAESDLRAANIDETPAFVYDMLVSASRGLLGVTAVGPTVALVLAAGVAIMFARGMTTPRFLAALSGAVAFTGADGPRASAVQRPGRTALRVSARRADPARCRGGVAEGCKPDRRTAATLAVVAAVVCVGNLQFLNQIGSGLSSNATTLRGSLVGLELAREFADPGYQPAPAADPQVTAGPYLAARDDFSGLSGGPARAAAGRTARDRPGAHRARGAKRHRPAPSASCRAVGEAGWPYPPGVPSCSWPRPRRRSRYD